MDVVDGQSQAGLKVSRERRGPMVQVRSARGFEWTRLTLEVAGLSPALDGLRFLHLTDLHCRAWWDPAYDDLITRVAAAKLDMVLFTGDFVDSKRNWRPQLPTARRLMAALTSRLGTFAILGNHDADLIRPAMGRGGIKFVDHHRLRLEAGEAGIELIGLPGVDREDLDMSWVGALGEKPAGWLRIAMCHFPNILPRVERIRPDVYLTGHTHGGQIVLPSGLPIIRHDSLPRHLCTGIHRAFGTVLVANRGFGFSSIYPFTSLLAVRIFCPAEVVEVTVRRG
jgi:uncharacterized protein